MGDDNAAAALKIADMFRGNLSSTLASFDGSSSRKPSSASACDDSDLLDNSCSNDDAFVMEPNSDQSSKSVHSHTFADNLLSAQRATTDANPCHVDSEWTDRTHYQPCTDSYECDSTQVNESPQSRTSPPSENDAQEDGELNEGQHEQPSNEQVTKIILVPRNTVGFIIGRNGDSIKNIIAASKASIDTDRVYNGDARKSTFKVTGKPDAVTLCCKLINDRLASLGDRSRSKDPPNGASNPSVVGGRNSRSKLNRQSSMCREAHFEKEDDQQEVENDVWVPLDKVGVVIGLAGANVRALRETSGAYIQVVNDYIADGKKRFVVAGPTRCVQAATDLIEEIVRNPTNASNIAAGLRSSSAIHDSPYSSPSDGSYVSPPKRAKLTAATPPSFRVDGSEQQKMEISTRRMYIDPKFVGCLIGQGGETKRDIEQRTGASIRISSDNGVNADEERLLTVSGTASQLEHAYSLISEYVPNMDELDCRRDAAEIVREMISVAAENIGLIIGREGHIIKDMQNQSGAFIEIAGRNEMERRGTTRVVVIQGTPAQVELAKALVLEKLAVDHSQQEPDRRPLKRKFNATQTAESPRDLDDPNQNDHFATVHPSIEHRLGRRAFDEKNINVGSTEGHGAADQESNKEFTTRPQGDHQEKPSTAHNEHGEEGSTNATSVATCDEGLHDLRQTETLPASPQQSPSRDAWLKPCSAENTAGLQYSESRLCAELAVQHSAEPPRPVPNELAVDSTKNKRFSVLPETAASKRSVPSLHPAKTAEENNYPDPAEVAMDERYYAHHDDNCACYQCRGNVHSQFECHTHIKPCVGRRIPRPSHWPQNCHSCRHLECVALTACEHTKRPTSCRFDLHERLCNQGFFRKRGEQSCLACQHYWNFHWHHFHHSSACPCCSNSLGNGVSMSPCAPVCPHQSGCMRWISCAHTYGRGASSIMDGDQLQGTKAYRRRRDDIFNGSSLRTAAKCPTQSDICYSRNSSNQNDDHGRTDNNVNHQNTPLDKSSAQCSPDSNGSYHSRPRLNDFECRTPLHGRSCDTCTFPCMLRHCHGHHQARMCNFAEHSVPACASRVPWSLFNERHCRCDIIGDGLNHDCQKPHCRDELKSARNGPAECQEHGTSSSDRCVDRNEDSPTHSAA